jgi:glucose-6-phosphate dehydrogenase assembly protein OpcA
VAAALSASANAAEDVWSEQGTSPDDIEAALRDLLRQRHTANEGLVPARVLNLVVIVDRDWKGEISNRLERVGRYHASRTILCAVEEGREHLDARVVMSYEQPDQPAGFGLIREEVEIDIGPAHLDRLQTIVDPVIVSELPTMVWSPHGHDDGVTALAELTDVHLLDSDGDADATEEFARAQDLLHSSYVVDLAWLRTTPWRERLASSFDPPRRRRALAEITGVAVRHRAGASASALLLVGWLASRLQWEPSPLSDSDHGVLEGSAAAGDRTITVRIEPVEQEAPGLAGVTISASDGFSLSLDRGPGGLHARAHLLTGAQRGWQVLGASRGESGILGEGVRQALLRDPTYGPALAAATRFC